MKKIILAFGVIGGAVIVFLAYAYLKTGDGAVNSQYAHTVEGRFFTARIAPENPDFLRNTLHAWIASISTKDGAPVKNATMTISGGMPAHGHGLPTAPQVTENFGDGRYRIDGVQFNMAGKWELKLTVTAGDASETVTFNLSF